MFLFYIGKSTLFENPIQENAKIFTNEPGVGRFVMESKSILLVHDTQISVLYHGRDKDKMKVHILNIIFFFLFIYLIK